MKKIFFSFAFAFLFLAVGQHVKAQPVRLSLTEAEKIMGEAVRLNDSSSGYASGAYFYKCSYFGISTDSVTGRIGKLYYMYEEYDKESEAHNVYQGFKTANEKNSPLKDLSFGDEGYYQGPPGPPPFILVRKGNKMLRLKVNKSTSHTSSEGFMDVAKSKTLSL